VLDAVLAAGVTALLVHSDREAMAIVDLALAKGLSVPGDLSLIAYDDEFAELFTPALTGVAPPRAAIGRAALDLLLARIADPDRPAHRVMLSPALNVRASTAPPAT
jgi:DNA-binding LacI/PurR family transcriptional regulator